MRFRWSGRAVLALAGGAAMLAGGAAAGIGYLGPGHPGPTALVLPSGVAQRLTAIARDANRADGGAPVVSVSVARMTRSLALTSGTPGDFVPSGGGREVYLITMHGSFTDSGASVPPGASLPVGRYLSLVVDAATFAVTDIGLSPKAPPADPAGLGPVTYLKV